MRKIGVLKEKGVIEAQNYIDRRVIRGIARNEDKYLMIFSSTHNNYFFPGGGMKVFETPNDCLVREVQEEAGLVVSGIKETIGYIDEIKHHNFAKRVFIQRTIYCKCEICGECSKKLEDHEKNYEVKWVTLDEAIAVNEKVAKKPFFIEREIMIMKELRKEQ